MDITELLSSYRSIKDQSDELAAQKTGLEKQMDGLERRILAAMTDAGLTAEGSLVRGGGCTAARRIKWRAKIGEGQWDAFLQWATENERGYLVQKRVTDTKVMELVDAGIELPDFLSVESFEMLDIRRCG